MAARHTSASRRSRAPPWGERLTAAGLPLDGIETRDGDTLYDFDIFTNRPDCMNHLGVARSTPR